ncbi:MAG: ribose-phosphate diphosphokinase [Alphaproteobacteria bacterium]|nr:ribose-phosphate diphosphokinase [Alphaproteobacteria bacterium]
MSGVVIQSLSHCIAHARQLAGRLSVRVEEIGVHAFPDGEIRVTVAPAADVTIVYATLDHPNEKIVTLLFAAEALRRGGARRLILVAPYLCYMRQDVAFRPGEAISQKVVGRMLASTFDRIVTVDAHLHRTHDIRTVFPGIESENLSAMPAMAESLRSTGFDPSSVVVGPDAESEPWVRELAGRLSLPHVVCAKTRRSDYQVDIIVPEPERVTGKPVFLVDDLVSSGGTLSVCARALKAAGAASIDAIVTHALFPPEAGEAFIRAGIRSVRSTNTVPHPTNAIALDAVLAEALLRA